MTPCVETAYRRTKQGYGQRDIRIDGVRYRTFAHRVAWIEAHGPIPEGLVVMHTCDNPPCINVEHLRLGTRAENNADMRVKRRQAVGEANGSARLTDGDVRVIRICWDRGQTASSLARYYGVDTSTVDDIVHRRSWKHIA